MRVLFLTASFHPLTGGAESYGRSLAKGLAALGHGVTVVTDGSWLEGLPVSSVEDGYRVIRLRAFAPTLAARDRVPWRQMQYSILHELGEVLEDEVSFDIVHANSHEMLMMGLVVAEDSGASLVASLHEQSPDLEPFGKGKCRVAYSVLPVDLQLAGSRFYRDRALFYGTPPERVRLIYHGLEPLDQDPDRGGARRQLGVADDEQLIVCPARVYERKGQKHLAAAFSAIRSRFPRAKLMLAGRVSNESYAQDVEALLADDLEAGRVIWRRDLTTDEMPDILAAADVVVQPSLEEGLGLACIEAMQVGAAVVATDVVGLNEVVTDGHDGLVVPASDPSALASAVIRMLEDPELRARLSAEARRTVGRVFSSDRMVRETVEAYETARDNRRAAASGGTPVPTVEQPHIAAADVATLR